MTPPTLSGNARCTRSARHPHPSCEAKQLGGRSDQPRPTDAAVKSPIEPAAPTVPPLPAISCLGAFQTPVFEPVAGLIIAGVRKPAQKRARTDPGVTLRTDGRGRPGAVDLGQCGVAGVRSPFLYNRHTRIWVFPMRAMDVMTTNVITVDANTSVQEVARLLSEWGISGVPVVDAADRLVGIVSEGDLLHRVETGTERVSSRRRSWWLDTIASDRELARDYVKSHGRAARDVMTREVVSVTEKTDLAENRNAARNQEDQ